MRFDRAMIYQEGAVDQPPTTVEVVDEGAGAFIVIRSECQSVRLDMEELLVVCQAARLLMCDEQEEPE
jgi:hypothetical protein